MGLVYFAGGVKVIRIAIVEDDEKYARQLTDFLHRYEQEEKTSFEIKRFRDGDEITEKYRAAFDIILMDVQMQFMDGISAAEEIRKTDSEVVIIFITNMRQYVLRGYAVDAMDYVLKPINYFAFAQRIRRALGRVEKRVHKQVTLDIRSGVLRVDVSDIYYVESQRNFLIYHTCIGDYESLSSMKEAENSLLPYNFFRGNKGYLINLAHVGGVNENDAIVHGEALLLSRRRKKQFLEALTNYWAAVR